jgi:hypothetical protein
MSHPDPQETISSILRRLTEPGRGERISLHEAIDELGDRAYGLMLLTLALPMAVPLSAIPGVSTIFGVPLILISAQLMLGRDQPWLPHWLGAKSLARADLGRMLDKALPWLERCERVMRPRLGALVAPAAERVIGAIAAFMAVIMSLPIVLGNQPPAVAIGLFALAIIEKDGLFAILGVAASVISVVLVSAVLGAFAGAAWYAISHFLQ